MLTSSRRPLSSASPSKIHGIPPVKTVGKHPALLTTPIPAALIPQLWPFLGPFFADSIQQIDDQALEQFATSFLQFPNLDAIVFGSPAKETFPGRKRATQTLCKRLIQKVLKKSKNHIITWSWKSKCI
jgi:hypothetical protein